MWSDNPVRDAERYAIEQDTVWEKLLERQPLCEICGNPIEPEEMYYEADGAYYHTDCLIGASKIMGVVA